MNNICYLLYVVLLCCFNKGVTGMKITIETKSINYDSEINNQNTVSAKNLDISFDQERYKNILNYVETKWDEYNEEYDSIENNCCSSISCYSYEMFNDLYDAMLIVQNMNINDAKSIVSTRYYWSLLDLLLEYHNFSGRYYIPLDSVQDKVDLAKLILRPNEILNNENLSSILKYEYRDNIDKIKLLVVNYILKQL